MSRRLRYHVVDVFTDTAFTGNPLAVVLGSEGLPTAALQAIAREFHLSETAFPQPPLDADRAGGADYRLRIFTPQTELPFAGHPSLGAAWVLVDIGEQQAGTLRQACGAGVLDVAVAEDRGRVTLHGGQPTVSGPIEPGALLAATGLSGADLAGPACRFAGTGISFGYLPVRADAVARAVPDLGRLSRLGASYPAGEGMRAADVAGVAVFSWQPGTVHLRMFAGQVGVTEDPATGSAALGLGVWAVAEGLLAPDGESRFTVRQGAELGRPSTLEVSVRADGGRTAAATVSGQVVPVASGEIAVPAG